MPKFRKIVTTVDAVQVPLTPDRPDWILAAATSGHLWELTDGTVRVKTNHGTTIAKKGDWIIRQSTGEVYPCNNEIFQVSYEPA